MDYEIVDLKEKIVVGVSAITSNEDPQMGEIIGGLWEKLYSENGANSKIKNKINEEAIGLYTDYVEGKYCITAGNEVSKAENDDLTVKTINAGKYAKFSVHGNMEKATADAWRKIWNLPLDRAYTSDFELYLNCDFENADIEIYVSLK